MAFPVQLTEDAARDLAEIFDYLDRHHSSARATDVLEQTSKENARLRAGCDIGTDRSRLDRGRRAHPPWKGGQAFD